MSEQTPEPALPIDDQGAPASKSRTPWIVGSVIAAVLLLLGAGGAGFAAGRATAENSYSTADGPNHDMSGAPWEGRDHHHDGHGPRDGKSGGPEWARDGGPQMQAPPVPPPPAPSLPAPSPSS